MKKKRKQPESKQSSRRKGKVITKMNFKWPNFSSKNKRWKRNMMMKMKQIKNELILIRRKIII